MFAGAPWACSRKHAVLVAPLGPILDEFQVQLGHGLAIIALGLADLVGSAVAHQGGKRGSGRNGGGL